MGNDNGVLTSQTLLNHLVDPAHREEAWRVFLERYRPLICQWCRRWGFNAGGADEVTAAVLAKLIRTMEKFVYDPTQSFRAWLRVIVDHEACDLWRQRERHPGERGSGDPRVQQILETVPAPGAVDELVGELNDSLERDLRSAREVVARVRNRVEENTWQAFWRTAIVGEPGKTVAAYLGLSVGAVYMAKMRVGKLLRDEGERLRSAANEGGGM